MKPGASLESIHTPVPGFNPKIHDQVFNYFKSLRGDNVFWRANWLITQLEGITPYEEEILNGATREERTRAEHLDKAALANHALFDIGTKPISELALRSEYQTIFKLPKTGCVVFGIHSYIDPLESLNESPKAAVMVARATSKMDEKTLKYRGINTTCKESIITYCHQISGNA